MRTPFNKVFRGSDTTIEESSASALWVVQLASQTKAFPDPSRKRVHFMDNFYTRHSLAKALSCMTDGEARVIGTVKLTNVDGLNRHYLSEAVQQIKEATRGTWCLVKAVDSTKTLTTLRKKHMEMQRKRPTSERVPFLPTDEHAADRAGYIIWKDTKVVVFYSNNLKSTPSRWIIPGDNAEAINCVHGLAELHRWTGDKILHRSVFLVPAPIVAYNKYMNGVDRMDQLRSTNPT
jgi:hypothetical protein